MGKRYDLTNEARYNFDLIRKSYKAICCDITSDVRYSYISKMDIFWSHPQNIQRDIYWSYPQCQIWSYYKNRYILISPAKYQKKYILISPAMPDMVTARFNFPAPSSSSNEILWVALEKKGIRDIKQMNQELKKKIYRKISNKWTRKYKTNLSQNIKFPIKLPLAPCRADPENTFRHKLKRKKIF